MPLVHVIGVLALLGVAATLEIEHLIKHPEEWQLWKAQHNKGYQSQREELKRHQVWLANREFVKEHNRNAKSHGYSLALNHFGDLV